MNDAIWHKCKPPFRSIFLRLPGPDGTKFTIRLNGAGLWRRKVAGKWEYQQDEPTAEEFSEQAW